MLVQRAAGRGSFSVGVRVQQDGGYMVAVIATIEIVLIEDCERRVLVGELVFRQSENRKSLKERKQVQRREKEANHDVSGDTCTSLVGSQPIRYEASYISI
jgi:hypothetical protein